MKPLIVFIITTIFLIPSFAFSAPGDLTDECAICLEYKNRGVEVQNLQCGHTYCKACIDKWSKRHMRDARGRKIENLCPECNAEIRFSGNPIRPSLRRSVTCNII